MTKSVKEVPKRKNSSMASNFNEMKEHGKVMEHVSSNEEVRKSGKTPDPLQHEKKEYEK
ncbi:hypothetical protein [Fictibacillus phosphorivorans]|uniref:hypothetical protein n=1 Tax=Fictibacillus phosphorivorans TaxID=1221500 RepID=UPI00203C6A41|nr:hypothetical protein [Fictibacillus phosphorivorans]MCM3717582.1 hypothetical protein [Fictibacillus phosphorivorans]MCM3775277.1 hypothetical protein [Fictibacillus phosphorivorans]